MENQKGKKIIAKGYSLLAAFLLFTTTGFAQDGEQKYNDSKLRSQYLSEYKAERSTQPLLIAHTAFVNYEAEAKKTSFVNKPYAKFIVPTALVAYGVTARFSKTMRNWDKDIDREVAKHNWHTSVDDYLQFAPAIAVYGLDLAGVPAKHNFRDRTIVLATSHLVMGITVETMKRSISVSRPMNRGTSSFPSGHTAEAFVGAHILMKEYNHVSPWISVGGYAVATSVGVMRITNRRHWISDVAAGAGIGILSAEVGYMLLPMWQRVFGIKDKDKSLAVLPTAVVDMQGNIGYGMGMAYHF